MASDYQAISYAEAVPGTKAAGATVRWSRVLPLMLLVPIVFAFGTPILAFSLLAAVLAAPVLVAVIAVVASKQEL
jgi:hypothetical protein